MLAAEKAACGVDIQQVYSIDPDDRFIQNAFHEEEIAYLKQYKKKAEYLSRLFSLWTAKEAYLKAVGSGINGYPQWLGLLPDPKSPADFKIISGVKNLESDMWTIRSLNAPDGYQAAFAISGQVASIQEYRFEPLEKYPIDGIP